MQTLHNLIPMGTRVRTKTGPDSGFQKSTGTVVGIASMHVIYNYIVLLDSPMEGGVRAISVPGTHLESEDGTTDWCMR